MIGSLENRSRVYIKNGVKVVKKEIVFAENFCLPDVAQITAALGRKVI